MNNLLPQVKILTAADAASAGTTTLSGSIVIDTQGYLGAIMLAALGDITSTCVLNLSIEGNTGNSTTGMAAITGATTGNVTATATSCDLKVLAVDLFRPSKRYIRSVLARGTANAVLNSIICILYKCRKTATGIIGDVVGQAIVAP